MSQTLLTPYQSQYVAWLLTRRAAGDTVESLASTLVDSQVDLNPHQVDAALFACRNPLSRGVILADEVGLGKTIEAGLVSLNVSNLPLAEPDPVPAATASVGKKRTSSATGPDLFGGRE